MAEKHTVYVETSVVSYLTARPSRDLLVAAHQQLTYEWWHDVMPVHFAPLVSEAVLMEAARGNPEAAARRLEVLKALPVLPLDTGVKVFAEHYADELAIPPKAAVDAVHLAVATRAMADYLVTWSCTHLCCGPTRRRLPQINAPLGLITPTICTAEELMKG